MLPASEPASALESGRLERSIWKVKDVVVCGGMVTTPLCGMIQGTSATRTPVSVPFPLLVKLTVPVGDVPGSSATSTRLFDGCALTGWAGGDAESNLIGIWRPWATPDPCGMDTPSNTPAALCDTPVMVT